MDALLDTCGPRSVTWLLLLQLCVVKAAADCPKPQGGVNIVLTNNALLMNAFPEGVDVTLECANGYVVESGTGSMSCVDNKWTEPDLTCKKKDCGPPRAQPHMSFNISAGTLFGALVKVVCDEGFQVAGSSYKQCYAFGWSGRAKCGFVTCDKPADVTNGRSSWEFQAKPTYGEIIRYVCNHGYALVGKHSVVCSATGEYDSPPPTCEATLVSLLFDVVHLFPPLYIVSVFPLSTVGLSSIVPCPFNLFFVNCFASLKSAFFFLITKKRSKRGRQRIQVRGRQGQQAEPRTRTGRREKDTELETTIRPETRERLTQHIGGETQVYDIRQ
ncbi:complement factor H isoform X3 [Pseudoliparis swirei]|uniref:complement factor H isoform X3 n=1 Tax=Pseudoliparis swirei TaxID=2059687 RepID=UPI0024BDA811|nr:complement factor H isoform X3 [Pseudoliparis swirei]